MVEQLWKKRDKVSGGGDSFASVLGPLLTVSAWCWCPQIQHNQRRKMKRKVKVELLKLNTMTEAEASAIQDIWQLDLSTRWQLYRCGYSAQA